MSKTQERPKRRVDLKRRISESGEELCAVCSDVVKCFAVGECDHPICFRCSTRMRVLCEQMYCAICRADLPKVAFTKKREAKFEQLDLTSFRLHHKHKIFFEDDAIKSAFFDLQEHRCNICDELKPFRGFIMLKDHMRKVHQLFSCDLCLKHIKIFSKDRKFYDRRALGEHRRIGDKDDRSHKGHPLCKFCDERYLDNDELLKHLRKQHYYCHFCEADGITNEYYDAYNNLQDHFRHAHFLCEEEDCLHLEFTNAFRDEIDLKAHKAAVHRKNLKKAMAKAARTLDIDFNLAPRGHRRDIGVTGRDDYEDAGRDDRRGAFGRGRGMSRRERERQREEEEFQRAMTASLNQATSVSVVDPRLLAPATLSNSSDDIRADKGSNRRNEKMRSDARPKNDKNKPKRSPDQQRRLFEESKKHDERVSSAPVRSMRDDSDSDSDSGDYRATLSKSEPAKEPEKKPEPPVEAAPIGSLAQKVKLANNFSVQSGGMNRDDFPSLGGDKTQAPVNDFPALGGKSSPRPSTQNKSKPSAAKSSAKPAEDFPTLGGGAGGGANSSAKTRSQSTTSSSWAKGAPVGANKPVTTKAKTSTNNMVTLSHTMSSSRSSKSSISSDNRQHTGIMNESSSDFPSLSSIGGALLKGKVTGSASEALAQYASSTSAAQPVTSNVKVVKEKPQPVAVTIPKAKSAQSHKDFPSLSSSSKDSHDFPTLGGQRNTAVTNTNAAPTWGPTSKPAVQLSQHHKVEAETGILKLKTKSKKTKKEPAPAPVIESSSESLKSEEPVVKEAEFKLSRDTDNSDAFQTKKTKGKKGQQQSTSKTASENSQSFNLDTESVHKDKGSSKSTVDPVQAFLKHLQEEEKKQKPDSVYDDVSTSQSENKKSKKKKKKKGKVSPDNEEDEFFPGPVKSSENPSEVSNKENFSSSTINSKVTPSSFLSGQSENSTVYQPKIGIISAKPAVGNFPSVHDSTPHAPTRRVDLNDFPALAGDVEKSKVPPPGFNKQKAPPGVSKAPPGVSAKAPPGMSKPPPGFIASAPPGFNPPSSPIELSGIANGILSQKPVGIISTGVNQGSTVIDGFQYAKPQAFDIRNRNLITDIQECISEERFAEFKRYSGEFRRNSLDAVSYYAECSKVLGKKNFDQIFPELLALLPDIVKQQELLKAHNKALKSNPVVKLSSKSGSTKTWQQDDKFTTCPVCQQVLLSHDMNEHMDSHVANTADFPVLGPTVGKNVFGMGSWSISAS